MLADSLADNLFLRLLTFALLVIPGFLLIRDHLKHRYKPDRSREWESEDETPERHHILNKGQIDAILSDAQLDGYGEEFTVAALKRRLDFLDYAKQKHESNDFFVIVERIGRALKLKWRFKPTALRWYHILGFRRTGGFFSDVWDESNNGILVIQSDRDGETTELLKDGEAVFYTLFLKSWGGLFGPQKRSPLRFQVTISTSEEIDALKMLIARLQGASSNTDHLPNISRAVRELGRNVEFENAIAQEEKVWAQQIDAATDSPEEKMEKLERLHEMVAKIRDDYQT